MLKQFRNEIVFFSYNKLGDCMNIKKIIIDTDIECDKDIIINKIICNSKKVNNNDLFVAIKGTVLDGHDYIDEAIKNGASVIIVDKDRYEEFKSKSVLILKTNNTRKIVSKLACNFYNNPSKEFFLIGITGTKGKTTSSFMIRSILMRAGKKVGLIGTIGNYIDSNLISESSRTTPDSIYLQKLFRIMADNKCEYVIMEVSSLGLKYNRVDNSYFNLGVFTNFSIDHISKNEHCNIYDYYFSKLKLFNQVSIGIINIDDNYTNKITSLIDNCNFLTFSIFSNSNLKAKNIIINKTNTIFKVNIYNKEEEIKTMPGMFEVYNALGSILVSTLLKIDIKYIKEGLKNVVVKGRSERVNNNIIIDYANNPNSLENILKTINSYKKGELICVFGCGGNRDKDKRPIMGKISGLLSDYTIITSDNPRYEKKEDIINDIEQGIKKVTNNYKIIVDRKDAIKYAIEKCKKDDIILLAGKGHETYEEINGKKYHFDEREIIKKIIEERSINMKEYIVDENIILMDYLRKTLTKLSKNNIKSLLSKEMIVVNGTVQTKFNYELKKGDKIVIRNTKIKSKKLKHDLNIIYEDEDLIVINKPAGLLTIATAKEKEYTLYHFVMEYIKEKEKHNKVFIIHRLDKETSGIVVFAKNQKTKNLFQNNWEKNVIFRGYYAIVEGNLKEKKGTIKSYLTENSEYMVYSTNNKKDGKLAVTKYKVLKENKNYSLLDINILTGRKNQIRVHMKENGNVIVGDKKYGSSINSINRMALHAYKLELIDPRNNKKISFKASMPTVFNKLVK